MKVGLKLCSQRRKKKRETETTTTESMEDEFMPQEEGEEHLNQSIAALGVSPCKFPMPKEK